MLSRDEALLFLFPFLRQSELRNISFPTFRFHLIFRQQERGRNKRTKQKRRKQGHKSSLAPRLPFSQLERRFPFSLTQNKQLECSRDITQQRYKRTSSSTNISLFCLSLASRQLSRRASEGSVSCVFSSRQTKATASHPVLSFFSTLFFSLLAQSSHRFTLLLLVLFGVWVGHLRAVFFLLLSWCVESSAREAPTPLCWTIVPKEAAEETQNPAKGEEYLTSATSLVTKTAQHHHRESRKQTNVCVRGRVQRED